MTVTICFCSITFNTGDAPLSNPDKEKAIDDAAKALFTTVSVMHIMLVLIYSYVADDYVTGGSCSCICWRYLTPRQRRM